jgi:hypothetical protein
LTLPHPPECNPDSDISDDYGDDEQDENINGEDMEGDTMNDLEATPRRSRKNAVKCPKFANAASNTDSNT